MVAKSPSYSLWNGSEKVFRPQKEPKNLANFLHTVRQIFGPPYMRLNRSKKIKIIIRDKKLDTGFYGNKFKISKKVSNKEKKKNIFSEFFANSSANFQQTVYI